MNLNKRISFSIILILGFVFFLPFLVLLKNLQLPININWTYLLQSFWTSCQQAGLVVLLCAVISLVHFRALYFFSQGLRKAIKSLLLAPILLPSIFTILIALSIINPFPFGLSGVVIVFFLTYFGFYFVSLSEVIESKIGQQYLIKEIYGISKWSFLVRILWPQIMKDVLNLSLIVFIGCFSSLSVPLVASGGRSVNFELYIYETIFVQNDWNSAVVLALIQALMLLVLGLWIKKFSLQSQYIPFNEAKMRSRPSVIFILLYLLTYFGSLLYFSGAALFNVRWDALDVGLMSQSLIRSLAVFVVLGIGFTVFLVALIFLVYQGRSIDYFKFFLTPSSVIVGFAFYLFFSVGEGVVELFKISLSLMIVYSFGLFFNFVSPTLDQLHRQIIAARIYKIDFKDFLARIVWPQLYDKYFLCLSILLLIALTDFAVVKAVGAQTTTFGTFVYSYISSYRLQWAFVFCVFTLVIWFVFLNILKQVYNVFSQKS